MDVIDFLEQVGADARALHGSEQALREFVAGSALDPELKTLLVARDSDALYGLLGQGPLMAVQVPAEEEDAPDEDDGGAERQLPDVRP